MEITTCQIEKVVKTNEPGVNLQFTKDELALLVHFIKCRNERIHCSITGGYPEAVAFAVELVKKIEDARVW